MRGVVSLVLILVGCVGTSAGAQVRHSIGGRAIALGASGALTSVEGTTNSRVGLTLGRFYRPGRWREVALETALRADYRHVSDIDIVGFEAATSLLRPLSSTGSTYARVTLAAGLRQEWIGSFSEVRYPLGVDVGLMSLITRGGAFEVRYAFRRVLGDPVSNYSEHEIVFGVSLLFRNVPEVAP